jgi:hypothetical protein
MLVVFLDASQPPVDYGHAHDLSTVAALPSS